MVSKAVEPTEKLKVFNKTAITLSIFDICFQIIRVPELQKWLVHWSLSMKAGSSNLVSVT